MKKQVYLKDVCEKGSSNIAQKDLESNQGAYPIYGASGLIKHVDFFKQDKPYIAIVKDGAGVGRTMLLPAYSSVIGTMQYIFPKDNIHIRYLYHALSWMNLGKYYTGATIPHIYFKDYQDEPLMLPSMEEQEEIVSVLDKLDQLVEQRKQQLSKLDELVKSRFIEMFGDPINNDKGLSTISGDRLFKLSNGKTLPDEKRLNSGIPAYGGNGISWYTDEVLCDHDTIIIGRVGFQSGNVHYAKAPLWVTDNAMYLSELFIKDCELGYLCALMEHIDFTRYQDAGDLKKITQKPFMQMLYLLPPHEQQKEFLRFVEQTDKAKFEVQKSLEKLETLKKALMQKYFG